MPKDKNRDRSQRPRMARSPISAGTPPEATRAGERIAKVMARAGLCSRRDAERWIAESRVAINGVPLTTAALNVKPEDKITIDGRPLGERERTRLFLFHKPRGLVTTARDPEERPTIFDYLREHWPDGPRVVSVGRLDINSEGLLMLTNDGGLAHILELPSTGWVRRYRVRARGETTQATLDGLREAITIDGIRYGQIDATLDRVQGANCWLTMGLREGKNREIKRVLERLGLTVNRLIRLSYGPFQLGDLAEGAVKEVPTRILRDQLGPALAEAAGADFSIPLHRAPETAARAPAVQTRKHEPRTRAAQPSRSDQQVEPRAQAKGRPKPGPRKHISALRAESEKPGQVRKRIERRETADRAARPIAIEKLVMAASGNEKLPKRPPGRAGKGKLQAPRRTRTSAEGDKEKVPRQGRKPRAPHGAPSAGTLGAQRRHRPRKKS